MTNYLSYTFHDNEAFINTYDELPLWSAPFGLLLLEHLELKPNLTVIDIGSGAGFPLMELASRLGASCKLYGMDPWVNANKRAREKISNYALSNVEIIESPAEKIPFDDGSVDLIVSNLGINNFSDPSAVFSECHRVLKPHGKLALTTNLRGHWKLFYEIFHRTLQAMGKEDGAAALKQEEEHRGTMETVGNLFTENGFELSRQVEDSFDMRFLDGSAFLNHHFIKLGWLGSWMDLFEKAELPAIFTALEQNLNIYAQAHNGLTLSVPMAYMEGIKKR